MRILYIFPHPDDESFGPARAIAAQRRQGHDVYLLTLTRGEATKVRFKFGWTREQMGEARYREMMDVKTTLDLTDLRVLNLPDGGLKEIDPWTIEKSIRDEMLRVEPHVVVTFPVHGISGFHDHIVTHFAVTRVYVELHGHNHPWLQRLAFFTLVAPPADFPWHVNVTDPSEIDCVVRANNSDMEQFHRALDCYVTYADVIAQTKVHQIFDNDVHFELFREDRKPPLEDLCEGFNHGTSIDTACGDGSTDHSSVKSLTLRGANSMERYLIETPHTAENCLALIEEVHAQGYLNNFDWGCRAGVHTGWVVIEAESEEQAYMAVPPLVRKQARVTRLNKFDISEVGSLHKEAAAHHNAK
jgi:LmbE family N-acetylglucosaminyl deacetylase